MRATSFWRLHAGHDLLPKVPMTLLGERQVGPQVLGGLGKMRTYKKHLGKGSWQTVGNSNNELMQEQNILRF